MLVVVALSALALPAETLAATASIQGKRIYYTAAPGELNDLSISSTGQNYIFFDPGARVTGGPGCTAAGNTAACPVADINGVTVNVGDGTDKVENKTSLSSTLSGGEGNDSLGGGFGNDTLRGNKGVDTHTGGAGDDLIDSRGDQPDIVSCGIGNDVARVDSADTVAADCQTVDRGGSPPPGRTSGPSPTAAALLGRAQTRKLRPGACAIDTLGTPGDDRLDGTSLGENLFGLQGSDLLNGRRGDDCLFGGVGSDRLSGAEGDDRLLGDDSGSGVGGDDLLHGNAGNDLLIGGSRDDKLSGDDGKDHLSGSNGDDRLYGGRGDDRLFGGHGRNRLVGGPGDDRLNALNGNFDRLNCGPGRDRAFADRGDRVRGCERVHRRR